MNWLRRVYATGSSDAMGSDLYDEATFYKQFIKDVLRAKEEVIIESPFITKKRMQMLKPVFERLMNSNIKVFVITRDPREHDNNMAESSEEGIRYFEDIGVQVLLVKGGHHRKLAMDDRKILWEGSLNILSQSQSREIMRRIESRILTEELIHFLKFDSINIFGNNSNF